ADLKCGVSWGFQPYQFGGGRYGIYHITNVRSIGIVYLDAKLAVDMCKQPESSAVDIIYCQYLIPGIQEFYYSVNSCQATGKSAGICTAFQPGYDVLQRRAGRIVAARIVITLMHTGCFLYKSGCLVNGNRYGTR